MTNQATVKSNFRLSESIFFPEITFNLKRLLDFLNIFCTDFYAFEFLFSVSHLVMSGRHCGIR